jgi:hypothetical protein
MRRRYRGRDQGSRWRQEEQGIEVALRIGGPADAEVDVGHGQLRLAARADGPDDVALGNAGVARHVQRAEVEERRRVPVGRGDRERLAARRNGAGKRDGPARRCHHRRSRVCSNVDAAMEAAGVRIGAEAEPTQDWPLHRPGPAARCCGSDQRRGHRAGQKAAEHRPKDLLPVLQTEVKLPGPHRRCQICLQRSAVEPVSRHTREPSDEIRRLAPRQSGRD